MSQGPRSLNYRCKRTPYPTFQSAAAAAHTQAAIALLAAGALAACREAPAPNTAPAPTAAPAPHTAPAPTAAPAPNATPAPTAAPAPNPTFALGTPLSTDDFTRLVAKSAPLADALAATLQTELQRAIKQGGPIAAISVCHDKAPAIAAQLSTQSGAHIRRIALRTRNPQAEPSAAQRERLTALLAAPLTADGKPQMLAWRETTSQASTIEFLRAIPLGPLCVTCHGEAIAPDLSAAIKKLYPDDQAVGFKLGELRGAFAITWPGSSL